MARSKGHKRLFAAVCVVLSGGLALCGLGTIAILTGTLAGGVAVVGLGHAVREHTIKSKKALTFSAIIAIVLAVAPYIPALAPYLPLIQEIAALLAALGVGDEVIKKIKK